MIFRTVEISDIPQIQIIEREYYEGFSLPKKILRSWIKKLPENFIVAIDKNTLVGFIFFEYLEKEKAISFIHNVDKTHKLDGNYLYISEIGVLNKYGSGLMQRLLKKALEKGREDKTKVAIWLI